MTDKELIKSLKQKVTKKEAEWFFDLVDNDIGNMSNQAALQLFLNKRMGLPIILPPPNDRTGWKPREI